MLIVLSHLFDVPCVVSFFSLKFGCSLKWALRSTSALYMIYMAFVVVCVFPVSF